MKNHNTVYIIHAAKKSRTTDPESCEIYACANSFELVKKIAQKDEEDGKIFAGWNIQEIYLATSEEDI